MSFLLPEYGFQSMTFTCIQLSDSLFTEQDSHIARAAYIYMYIHVCTCIRIYVHVYVYLNVLMYSTYFKLEYMA